MRAASWVAIEAIQIANVSGAPTSAEQRHGGAADAHVERRAERPLEAPAR